MFYGLERACVLHLTFILSYTDDFQLPLTEGLQSYFLINKRNNFLAAVIIFGTGKIMSYSSKEVFYCAFTM
jgi:hypothetical protein